MSLLSENKNTTLSVVGAVSALAAIYSIYRSIYPKFKPNEIPIPAPCLPYVGNMATMGELPGKKIAEWHAEYGPIIRVRMGVQTWIMVGDPTLAHEIFVSKHGIESAGRLYSTYASKYYSAGKKGVVFADANLPWKKARAVVSNMLGQKSIEKFMDLIEKGSSNLAERLIQETQTNGSVNPVKNFEFFALSTVGTITLGKKFDSLEDPDFKKTTEVIERSVKFVGFEFDLPNFLPVFRPFFYFLGIEKKMREFVKNERNVEFGKYINESRKNNSESIITALLNDTEHFDEEDILVIISDMLVAGAETVSTTLTWAMSILCNYPEVQKKIQHEIDTFIQKNGSIPTFSDRAELPYCNSVMKECMRHKPPTPFGIPHRATKELEIRGYTIPKDSIIIPSMDYMHVGAGYYANDDQFIPERFMDDPKTMSAASNGKFSERDQFNFGWGRRICPGIHLAEVEIFNAYVNIFAKSTVEPIYKEGKPVFPDISGARSGGGTTLPLSYNVRFVKRA